MKILDLLCVCIQLSRCMCPAISNNLLPILIDYYTTFHTWSSPKCLTWSILITESQGRTISTLRSSLMQLLRNFNQSYHRSQNCNHSVPQPYLTLGGVSASDILNSDLKVQTVTLSCSCIWNVLGPHYTLFPNVCLLLEVLTIHEFWSVFVWIKQRTLSLSTMIRDLLAQQSAHGNGASHDWTLRQFEHL